jgi:hypothetical protein
MNNKEKLVEIPKELTHILGTTWRVRWGYSPFEREDINFINAKKLPYLWMAIINQDGDIKLALSDVPKHEIMWEAMKEDIKENSSCEFGQVWLGNGLVEKIWLHQTKGTGVPERETKEKILSIIGVFDSKLLRPEPDGVVFCYAAYAGDRWNYLPKSGKFIKHPM